MHISLPKLEGSLKVQHFLKSKMVTADFDGIRYRDAQWPSQPDPLLKIWKFENPICLMVAILKIEQLWYLQNCLPNFDKVFHSDPPNPNGCSKKLDKAVLEN